MSPGSYFPKPVKLVEIPKTNGGKRFLGIPTIEDISDAELLSIIIGQKRALQIVAMFALARRRNESEVILKDKIKSSTDAFRIFQSIIGDLPCVEFWVLMLMLNRANKVIKKVRISEGGISGTVVDPKKVFKFSL